MRHFINTLAQALIPVSTNIVKDCLRYVKIEGDTAKSGSIYGEKGDELIVDLSSGEWADIKNFEHKGDLLNLIYFTIGNRNWPRTYDRAKKYIDINKNLFNEKLELDTKPVALSIQRKLDVSYDLWKQSSLISKCKETDLKILDKTNILYRMAGTETRFAYQIKYLNSAKESALIFRITDQNRKFCGLLRRYLVAERHGHSDNIIQDLPLGDVIGGCFKLGNRKPTEIILTTNIDDVLSLNTLKSNFSKYGFWSGLGYRHTGLIDIPPYVEKILICIPRGEDGIELLNKIKFKYENVKFLKIMHVPKNHNSFYEFYNKNTEAKFVDFFTKQQN